MTIGDSEHTYAEITNRFTEFFANYQPVPIGPNPLAPYIVFGVDAPAPCTTDEECNAPGANTWRSDDDSDTRGPGVFPGYELWIYWSADTDALFPNPETLHDTGSTGPDSQFDINITLPGSYNPGPICFVFPGCVDPAIGGRDDMFQELHRRRPDGLGRGSRAGKSAAPRKRYQRPPVSPPAPEAGRPIGCAPL